jgi:putative flippase GtrA
LSALGFRLWLFVLLIGTAVTVLLGFVLRNQWPAAIADPIAQAIGFTVSFLLAWPWFRSRSDERLKFPAFAAFVTAVAVVMAFIRIQYFP